MNTPHYLRFVKALVLTAAIPACSEDVADGSHDASAPPDADVDAGLPFSSGPLAPPELPVGFA